MSRAAAFKTKRLAAEDRAALLAHLCSRQGKAGAEALVNRIECYLATMRAPADERAQARESAAFWENLAAAAAHLASFVDVRSLWETHWQVSKGLIGDLERIERNARRRAEAQKPSTRRGRPSAQWREGLVGIVDGALPAGNLKQNQHRSRTLQMVLGFIGAPAKDLKSTVRDTRRRIRS